MTIHLEHGLLLVGAGKMGGAMLKGWLDQGLAPGGVMVRDPAPPTETAALLKSHGIEVSGDAGTGRQPSVIVLAVKPQIMDDVLPDLAQLAGPETLVLSIAAGRTVASILRHFPAGTALVRAMPNTPAAIGRGMMVAFANETVSDVQRAICDRLLGAVGKVAWVGEESALDGVTAVSGSGPAYVFYLAECLAEAGVAAGLDGDLAKLIARQTVAGAGELLARSDEAAATLRRNVTSPGGTTAAALEVLMAGDGLADLMTRAVAAAARRSRELAE